MVRAAGLEPARPKPRDFLTNYDFRRRHIDVCGLDFLFTLALALGARRQVSTPSLSGLARDYHLTGFPEFDEFYICRFQQSTQILIKSLVSTNFTTPALCPFIQKKNQT